MITLFRWFLLQQKRIKIQLALYQFLDGEMDKIIKNPEELEQKLVSVIAEIIHNQNQIRE